MSEAQSTGQPAALGGRSGCPTSQFARVLRLAVTAIVVAACCYAAYGVGKFWAEWRRATQPIAARQLESTDLSPLAASLPLAGPWSFDELDWNLRSQLVKAPDVDAQFAAIAAAAPARSDELLPDTDQDFIDLITSLHILPTEHSGNEAYRVNRADLKAMLVVRKVAGRNKTAAFAIAYPAAGEQWQLFEFTPRSQSAAQTKSSEAHLLPLPAGARRSGGRFADDGRVLLEFVSLDSTAPKLIAAWNTAGWEVRPSGLGDGHQFSYLCARGDDVIYAWSADPPDALKNLMLVRTPSSADTSP